MKNLKIHIITYSYCSQNQTQIIYTYFTLPSIIKKMGCCANQPKNRRCRVYLCQERHQRHYCRVCQDSNSDHFAKNCPNSIIAYHGTSSNVRNFIETGGFKPSETGNLGKGVYFTDDQVAAQQISCSRAGQRNAKPIVYQCRIPKNLAANQESYHGKWQNVTENGFKEFVVRNPNRIKVLNVQQV